jgi:hypothetical protein
MNNNIQERSFSAEPLPGSSARASVRANEAYQRLVKSDVKYRFVIDMASPK